MASGNGDELISGKVKGDQDRSGDEVKLPETNKEDFMKPYKGDGEHDESIHEMKSPERKMDDDMLKDNEEQLGRGDDTLEELQNTAGTVSSEKPTANVGHLLTTAEPSSTPEGNKIGEFVVDSTGSFSHGYGFYECLSDKEKIRLLEKQNYLLRDANKDKHLDLSNYKSAAELALKTISDASKILIQETTRFSTANEALIRSAEKLDLDEKEFGQLAEIISKKNKEVLECYLTQLEARFYGNFAASAHLHPSQIQSAEADSLETNRFLPSVAGFRSTHPLQEKERGEFETDGFAASSHIGQYGQLTQKVEYIEPENAEGGDNTAECLTPVTKRHSKRKRDNVISDSDDDVVEQLEFDEDEDEDPVGPFDYVEQIEDPKEITNQFFDEPNWAIKVYDIGVNEFAMLPKHRKRIRENSRQYHMLNTNDLTNLYRGGGTDVGQRKEHPGEIPIFDVNLKLNHNRYIPEAEIEYCRQLFLNYALKKTMKSKKENCDQIIHKIFNYLMLKMATSWRPYEARTHFLFQWAMNRCLFIMNKYGSSVPRQLFASQAIPWINSCFVVAFNSGIDLAPQSFQEEYYLARMLLKCKNSLFNGNPIVRLPAPILQTEEPIDLERDTYTQFYYSDEEKRAKIDEVANFNSHRNQMIGPDQTVLIKATRMRKIVVAKEKETVKEPVSKKSKPFAPKPSNKVSSKSKSAGIPEAIGSSDLKKKSIGNLEKKRKKEEEMPSSSKDRRQIGNKLTNPYVNLGDRIGDQFVYGNVIYNTSTKNVYAEYATDQENDCGIIIIGPGKRHANIIASGGDEGDESDDSYLSDINDDDKVESQSKSKNV